MVMEEKGLRKVLDSHKRWLKGEMGGERASLVGADLSDTKLAGLDLEGADLRGANLERADLSGADLSNTNMQEAKTYHKERCPKSCNEGRAVIESVSQAEWYSFLRERERGELL